MLFGSPFLHPSSLLLACLVALAAIQFVGTAGLLAALAMLALAVRGAAASWWRLIVRMRWLLASAWLIMAYGVPGDAWLDRAWLPTEQGIAEASLHAGRLVFSLGCLAWLFHRLPADALMVALIGLLPRSGRLGTAGERLAVRLWLVMELLHDERRRPEWRQMLDSREHPADLPNFVRVTLPLWRPGDAWFAAGIGALAIALAIAG